jgi:hypothetical protein
MTGRRGVPLVAVFALVAVAAAVLVALSRAGLDAGATPSPVAATASGTGSTRPLPPASPAVPVTPPASPAVPVTTPVRPVPISADAVPAGSPAPFVQRFADGPAAGPIPRQKSPTAPLKVPAFVDGCDHNYGTPTQCVPLAFPSGVAGATGKCSWLAAHGFTGLIVAGKDSQGLDADGDGTVCD